MSTEPTTGPVDTIMLPDEFDFEQEDFTPPNAALMQVMEAPEDTPPETATSAPEAAREEINASGDMSPLAAQNAANEEVERPSIDVERLQKERFPSPEEATRLREVNERALREHHARQRSTRPPGAKAPKAQKQRPRPDDVEGPLDALLRDRDALLDVIEQGKGLVSVARVMLLTVVVCAAALGASVGMYRGGVQILFAAIKLPMVLLLTTAVCAPVYTTLKLGMRQPASLPKDFALVLSALALSSVVAASLSPLLLLAIFNGYAYHTLTLLLVGICGLGGVCGFLFFVRGLRRQVERAERLVYLVFLCVIGVVSMQFSWLARPYLVRPQTDEVPFMRAIEGSFFEAVRVSTDSARGIYSYPDKFSAPSSSPYYGRGATIERAVPARDLPDEAASPPAPASRHIDASEPVDTRDAALHVEARETEAMLVGEFVEQDEAAGQAADDVVVDGGEGEVDADISAVEPRGDVEVSP